MRARSSGGARRARRAPVRAATATAVAVLWGIVSPAQLGASTGTAAGDDGTIQLDATDDGSPPAPDAAQEDGPDRERAKRPDHVEHPDLVPGVRRVLSQRFSYGGFDVTVVSVRVLEDHSHGSRDAESADPTRMVRTATAGSAIATAGSTTATATAGSGEAPGSSEEVAGSRLPRAADPSPASASPPTGTTETAPPAAQVAAATLERSAVPVIAVGLRARNITPTQGPLEGFRLRAGRSVYVASDVHRGGVDSTGTREMLVEFRVPRPAAALIDSAMLVVGAPGTSQAAVPLGSRAPEPSVRHPRTVVDTVRSTVFGPGQDYPLGSFELYRVEYGASVSRLEAPDAGMRWLGVEYGLCVQGDVAPVRPTLVLPESLGDPGAPGPVNAGLPAVGVELRAGTARGSIPMAPPCPGWATALAHWQVPLGTEGTVRIELVDDAPRPHVVGNLHLEVPELPAESDPPSERPCAP